MDFNIHPKVKPAPVCQIRNQTTCSVCVIGIDQEKVRPVRSMEETASKEIQLHFFFDTVQDTVDLVNAMKFALENDGHARLCPNCKELFIPESSGQTFCYPCLPEFADVSSPAEAHL